MKLNEYENKALADILEWEKSTHKGVHKKVLDITSKPVEYVIEKIGREKFEKFEKVVETTVRHLLTASKYTVNSKDILKRAHDHGIMIKSLKDIQKCDLSLLDKCNRENIKFHERAGAIQGAITGLAGGFLAAFDLASMLIQAFHLVQEICYCYSYKPNSRIEREIILRILEGALGSSEMKWKAIKEIKILEKIKNKNKIIVSRKGTSILGSKAMEGTIEDITVALIAQFMRRAIPIISVALSSHSNHEIMEHSGNTAFMIYRKRFLERKKTQIRTCCNEKQKK
ncbi:MAG: EcsC family protein [Candidatus Omnitrophica bacterium]|nr:EcsC family protein [Candidatus Omnitrophota bacterium]